MDPFSRDRLAKIIGRVRTAIASKAIETPLATHQQETLKENRSIEAWPVTHLVLPAPPSESNDLRDLLFEVIKFLGRREEQLRLPIFEAIQAQWTNNQLEGNSPISSKHILGKAMHNCHQHDSGAQSTIFYVQGGAFTFNSPYRFRNIISSLAEHTNSRCFSINYRLAPQNPFPAGLLDVLVGYLSLLYPPSGAFHAPISASSIVLAGDSSGACLLLALVQIILAARKLQGTDEPIVRFHGHDAILLMPSGLALQSPYVDQTNALPSWIYNGTFDLVEEVSPLLSPDHPPCSIWPSNPPRANVYCESSMTCHPLVSPLAAPDWAGAPPMGFALGEERMLDSSAFICHTATRQGVIINWESYEAMPHNWPMVFPDWWQSKKRMERWGEICRNLALGKVTASQATRFCVNSKMEVMDVRNISQLTQGEVEARMKAKQASLRPWNPRTGGIKL